MSAFSRSRRPVVGGGYGGVGVGAPGGRLWGPVRVRRATPIAIIVIIIAAVAAVGPVRVGRATPIAIIVIIIAAVAAVGAG